MMNGNVVFHLLSRDYAVIMKNTEMMTFWEH